MMLTSCFYGQNHFNLFTLIQVDADFKMQDMKKTLKELEMKGKGYKKRLDELETAITKHLEQYVPFSVWNHDTSRSCISSICFITCRIQKDLVNSEKLQATLADETVAGACDLKRALEMVTLLEAQLKEMNPNLDSISEY